MKLIVCLALASSLHAMSHRTEMPCPCPSAPIDAFDGITLESKGKSGEKKLGPPLKGIKLLGPYACIQSIGLKTISGIELDELAIPGSLCDLEKSFIPIYFGEPLSMELIKKIQKQLVLYYRDQGRPVVLVEIPPQDLTWGVLQLRVIEGKLGEIASKGNCWFRDEVLTRQIRLQEGGSIDSRCLTEDLAWLNRSPFHRTEAIFTPGKGEGRTDLELVTHDRFPLRAYAGADNTGARVSERTRIWAGFDWGFAFKTDQILSYQYSCAPDLSQFQSHTVHYTAPLPWRHILILYGGYATTHPKISHFRSEGKSAQGSLRYEIPLKPFFNHWLQELQLGCDVKYTNNNLSFTGTGDIFLLGNQLNISQIVLGYTLGWEIPIHKFQLNALAFYAPGRILPHQSDAAFNASRAGAQNQYLYARLQTAYTYTMPRGFELYLQGRFQKSSRPLVPSEQFSIGGYDTVRGYDERLFQGDNGVVANVEWSTPSTRFLGIVRDPRIQDSLYFLLFYDLGYAENITPIQDEDRRAFMMSAGAGLRYDVSTHFSSRIDWGFKLHTVSSLHDYSIGKLHLGVMLSL